MPALGHPGDAVPLQWRRRRRPAAAAIEHHDSLDHVLEVIRELRSRDPRRIAAALARPVPSEALPAVIELVGSTGDIARLASEALRRLAPSCTGMVIDAMLDDRRDEVVRRRMPAILADGDPELAIWGLWRGLRDASFQIRYRCGLALAQRIGDGPLTAVPPEQVFDCVRRELGGDRDEWRSRTLVLDALTAPADGDGDGDAGVGVGLAHVFRVLGFALPAEPLRVALRAVRTDDAELRAMALEYLESILPADLRAQLWPLLEDQGAPAPPRATRRALDDILADLQRDYSRALRHGLKTG